MRGWGRTQSTLFNCTTTGTSEQKWEAMYGTDAYGNLPQHKVTEHEGHCWQPCPYSTDTTDERTRALLRLAPTDPLPTKVDHVDANGRVYNMATNSRGPRWGYECTFDNCPYYLANGVRYFFI